MQISDGNGDAHIVHLKANDYDNAINLKAVLADESRCKIFHYARFDVAAIKIYLGVEIRNIFCTKIASKLSRTYTDHHGLKSLCKELLSVDLSKQQQCSNWAESSLSKEQIKYAASDVLYLHRLREKLNNMLIEDERQEIAQQCFDFMMTRVILDEKGWNDNDIFAHN